MCRFCNKPYLLIRAGIIQEIYRQQEIEFGLPWSHLVFLRSPCFIINIHDSAEETHLTPNTFHYKNISLMRYLCVLAPEYLNNQFESSGHQFQIWDSLKMHIFLGYFFFMEIVLVIFFFLTEVIFKVTNLYQMLHYSNPHFKQIAITLWLVLLCVYWFKLYQLWY